MIENIIVMFQNYLFILFSALALNGSLSGIYDYLSTLPIPGCLVVLLAMMSYIFYIVSMSPYKTGIFGFIPFWIFGLINGNSVD